MSIIFYDRNRLKLLKLQDKIQKSEIIYCIIVDIFVLYMEVSKRFEET